MSNIKIRRVDFYPVDWLEGTISLTHVERSVYITVCAAIYAQGGPVEASHVLKLCPGRWSKQGLDGLIAKGKVTFEGTHVVQKRCMTEVGRAADRVQSARLNGATGGRPIKGLAKPNGFPPTRVTPEHQQHKIKEPSSDREVAARTSQPNGRAGHAHDDETVAWKKAGNALPLASTPPPPLFTNKAERAAQHWGFLFEHGASGEAERYYAAMMESGVNCPPDEIFDAVEVRMTSA